MMANGKSNGNGKRSPVERERAEFRALLVQNPNYFGTVPGTKLKAVSKMKGNTCYEEIKCIGLYPELDLLEAIIEVKRPYGFKGALCNGGTHEYVRFFVDWDGDGDYLDANEDAGITCVKVNDMKEGSAQCSGETKPLSFAVSLKISSQRKPCRYHRLVKVRAILSWENPPPAGNPDFQVVWGHVMERWIQVRPSRYRIKDILSQSDLLNRNLSNDMLDHDVPISKPVHLTLGELAELYKGDEVPAHRYNFPAIREVVQHIRKYPSSLASFRQDPYYKDIEESVAAVLKAKPSTRYEELRCIGLNNDLEQLVAVLTVKLPSGYNGDLCSTGSREYVAFWIYADDEEDQLCRWQYIGTAIVNVHDIKPIPVGGVQYAAYLPVDLTRFRRQCYHSSVLRVRAVLSWNAKPNPREPDELPVWGNRVETTLLLQPGIHAVPGIHRSFIRSVGNMTLANISGNPDSLVNSMLGDGYANGVSAGGGFTAVESPFGGIIAISGKIAHQIGNPAPPEKVKYKVQFKKIGGTWKDIRDDFRIWMRVDGLPSGFVDQSADDNGYFGYLTDDADSSSPPMLEVQDDILAIWHTPVADGDGLYLLRLLVFSHGAPAQADVPAEHLASNTVKIMIDNSKPVASITLDTGPCREFSHGDAITGRLTATGHHLWRYSIDVLPALGPDLPGVSPAHGQYPVLPSTGFTNRPFAVSTDRETAAGEYVLRLSVTDRTIVNNTFPGISTSAEVQFCLLKVEQEGDDRQG